MAENVQTQINDAQYVKDLKAAIELSKSIDGSVSDFQANNQ